MKKKDIIKDVKFDIVNSIVADDNHEYTEEEWEVYFEALEKYKQRIKKLLFPSKK